MVCFFMVRFPLRHLNVQIIVSVLIISKHVQIYTFKVIFSVYEDLPGWFAIGLPKLHLEIYLKSAMIVYERLVMDYD